MLFLNNYSFIMYTYMCEPVGVPTKARRGPQSQWNRSCKPPRATNCVGAGNLMYTLCKGSKCSQLLHHLSIPKISFLKTAAYKMVPASSHCRLPILLSLHLGVHLTVKQFCPRASEMPSGTTSTPSDFLFPKNRQQGWRLQLQQAWAREAHVSCVVSICRLRAYGEVVPTANLPPKG